MGQVARVPQNGDSFPWYIDIQNGYKKDYIYGSSDLCFVNKKALLQTKASPNKKDLILGSLVPFRSQGFKSGKLPKNSPKGLLQRSDANLD